MKILVSGGAGYIGGTVSRLLLARGHSVTVYDNFCHSQRSAVSEGASLVEGELADRALLEKTLNQGRFDGILHFAALIEAGESMKFPEVYFRNNTAGTLSLLESMLATGHNKLVFSSTAACYGEPEKTPIREDARLAPTNPYGESKLLSEHMMRWENQAHGLRYAALRYFNVAGAISGYGENHEPESHLIPLLLDVAIGRREKIKVFGQDYPTSDGTCVRDYIHVQDLAEAHLLALAALEKKDSVIYNLGNGKGFTVMEVIESVRRVTGHSIPVDLCPRRPGDPAVLVASSEKIQEELGWRPRFADLDQIVQSAWEWHKILHGGA
jgi:UDP-glucose 4-epimerase